MTNPKVLRRFNRPPVDQLTAVESQIWEMHNKGLTRQQIGDALGMKAVSVGRRLSDIKDKKQAAEWAKR